MKKLAFLGLVVLTFTGGCTRAPSGTAHSQSPTTSSHQQADPKASADALPDPIGHAVDVHEKPWSIELAPDARLTETSAPNKSVREQAVTNGGSEAFVVSNQGAASDQIEFVYLITAGRCYRIDGIPLPNRPFSSLAWASDRYLIFDRWSEPHYGIHYIVDAKARRVVNVAPFPDQFYAIFNR